MKQEKAEARDAAHSGERQVEEMAVGLSLLQRSFEASEAASAQSGKKNWCLIAFGVFLGAATGSFSLCLMVSAMR